MLYRQWLETVERHAGRTAVFEGGRRWSFADIHAAVEEIETASGPVIARTGPGIGFPAAVIAAWRDGQAVIPVEAGAAEPRLTRQPAPEIRLVKYTPGASGVPRGVFLTGPQLLADLRRIATAMELGPGRVNLGVISPAHSYGFSNLILPLVILGMPLSIVPAPFPRVVEAEFRRHPGIVVPAVPPMWRAWLKSGVLTDAGIGLAVSAGSPLPIELEREVFASAGLKIHNFYGASECGAIAYDDSSSPRVSADVLGRPLPGVDLAIDDDARIRVSSDAVADSYDLSRPDDHLGGGVYQTRDLGFLDADGLLRLRGTTGGAINVAGRKVSPAKVEAALLETGLVTHAAVHAVPSRDPERFEEIAATVVLAAGANLDSLKSAAVGRLQLWEVPRHWRTRDPILNRQV
ncbi:MAG: long-chain fatty acid--CoA ligase [Akkermansiaceae bacterium]|nr:long-chain fatty acid--CoA ligase [Akkermansiaceae bacterium]